MLLQANNHPLVSGNVGAAEFVRPMKWVLLDKQYPAADEYVLIRMEDGAVEIGFWDPGHTGWNHSPFERWGTPVAWAKLPQQCRGEG